MIIISLLGLVLFADLVSVKASVKMPVMYDYNRVFFTVNPSYSEVQEKFLDTDGKANTYLFVGVGTEACFDQLFQPALLGVQRHAGKDFASVLLMKAENAPFSNLHISVESAESCAEVRFIHPGHRLDDPFDIVYNLDHTSLNDWVREMTRVESILITNGFNSAIDFYWHDESKTPLYQGSLEPGESTRMSTFLGHVFSANLRDVSDEDSPYLHLHPEYELPGNRGIIDYFAVTSELYTFHPKNRLETCDLNENHIPLVSESVSCENSDLLLRFLEFAHGVFHQKRIGLNFVQPRVVRAVTEDGFRHLKLPANTYTWLKDWYVREQLRQEEVESTAGPCMNQHVAPSTMTHLTPELKERLRLELQPILEDWYAQGPLTLTSIYGIRKYVNGSVLRMHVDTASTHVVSAIINVDQSVEKDWPLLILDHDDNEHNLIMQPGDMVLYESAKLLHGRPDTFIGSHYDNIFIHFQPVSGWDYDWL